MPSILLVHPDAERWPLPSGADVTPAADAVEARAYLAGTAFDVIYIGEGVENAASIGALRDVLGLSTPIETVADAEALKRRLSGGGGEMAPVLLEVRDELSRVAHALNNPLAVIAGNAQLAVEMAQAVTTDETIVESLDAIVKAASELEALFGEVAGLRARIDRAIENNV